MSLDPETILGKLGTSEECEHFAINVGVKYPEISKKALHKSMLLKAEKYGAKNAAELEAIAAVYAYEAVLAKKHGKKVTASRTWPMIERHGIINAVERAVQRNEDPAGYRLLQEMGLQALSFESVVLKYPDRFTPEAVESCKARLAAYHK